jgi:multiple antibiotic resistance protein
MSNILRVMPNTFIPLFVAMDVFMIIPIFISMTKDISKSERGTVVRDSIITALVVSIVFLALGEAIFRILGIRGDDFKIAGGLVLLVFAILDLLQRGEERRKPVLKMGVVPIGMPLIAGPAVLTTVLVLQDQYGVIATVIALLLNLFIVWISLLKAERIIKTIGRGGVTGLSKVMALLLASIAIMMIRLGIENIIKGVE